MMGDRFPEVNADYVNYYGAIDPRLKLVMTMPVGTTLACHHYFDDAFVRRNEFYNDFLLPNHSRFVAGCRILETGDLTTVFGLHRGPEHGPFESADTELLERLLPHLRRVVTIRQRLQAAEANVATRQAALDRLPTAVFVVAATGAVVVMNEAARQLIRLGDVLLLQQGRLSLRRAAEDSRLQGLIREAATAAARRGAGGGSLPISRNGGGAYAALIAPVPPDQAGATAEPAAMILMTDPAAAPRNLGRTVIELYGFSQAEARLAVMLAQGRTLQEAADERRVGLETIRSQLRSLLAKARASRQVDLVRVFTRIPEYLD